MHTRRRLRALHEDLRLLRRQSGQVLNGAIEYALAVLVPIHVGPISQAEDWPREMLVEMAGALGLKTHDADRRLGSRLERTMRALGYSLCSLTTDGTRRFLHRTRRLPDLVLAGASGESLDVEALPLCVRNLLYLYTVIIPQVVQVSRCSATKSRNRLHRVGEGAPQ